MNSNDPTRVLKASCSASWRTSSTIFVYQMRVCIETHSWQLDVKISSDVSILLKLKAIENGGPDVILMDISLPGMSGIEATIQVKGTHPGIDVIMLTVHDDDKKIFDALQAGASGYLLKNASPDDLCRAIFEVRAGGAPMSAEIARLVVEAFHRPASSEASQAFNLSKRETEIVQLVARGLANKEIAAELSISVETVRVHLKHIYEKLHVRSRTEAAMKYRDSLERAPWNK